MLMSLVVLPRLDFSFLAKPEWGGTSFSAVAGVWAVIIAPAVNWRRLPALRQTVDAGANASALPILTVSSLVGFGAVVASLPAFAAVRDLLLSMRAARWFRSPSR
jgi:H+/gluconate symporter-like permease